MASKMWWCVGMYGTNNDIKTALEEVKLLIEKEEKKEC